MTTFNRALWDASREMGERGDLARLVLQSARARVLSDFFWLRAYVEENHTPDTLAALDAWHAEYEAKK